MATASRFNRGYSGGLAAGSQAGGGFQSSFQSSFQNNTPAGAQSGGRLVPGLNGSMVWQKNADPNAAGMDMQPAAAALPPPPPTPSPSMAAPDMGNFFSAPLPQPGQGPTMNQPPPSPFGAPAPLPQPGQGPTMNQQPPSPFGGFYAQGGIAPGGMPSIVGERGPEMIVPTGPTAVIPNHQLPRAYGGGRGMPVPPGFTSTPPPMVPPPTPSPMAAVSSPMNRGYNGGLAARGPVAVGRSNYDLNRIAQRVYRQTKDPSMLMSMDYRNRFYPGTSAQAQPQPSPMPMQAPEATPRGHFVPGISPGAQVWVPDTPPAQSQPAPMPMQAPAPSALPAPAAAPAPMTPDLTNPMLFPPVNVQGSGQPAGLPPPPPVSVLPYGNTGYGTGVINGKPTGTTIPLPKPGTQFPPLTNAEIQQAAQAGYEATGVGPDGVPILKKMPPPEPPKPQMFKKPDGTVEYRQWNAERGGWEPVKMLDANGDGIPDSQQPGGADGARPPSAFLQQIFPQD